MDPRVGLIRLVTLVWDSRLRRQPILLKFGLLASILFPLTGFSQHKGNLGPPNLTQGFVGSPSIYFSLLGPPFGVSPLWDCLGFGFPIGLGWLVLPGFPGGRNFLWGFLGGAPRTFYPRFGLDYFLAFFAHFSWVWQRNFGRLGFWVIWPRALLYWGHGRETAFGLSNGL